MPTMFPLLLETSKLVCRCLVYTTFTLATILLLMLPYWTNSAFVSNAILRNMSIVVAPFVVAFLSMVLQTLLPHKIHLICGLVFYVIGILNAANHFGMFCTMVVSANVNSYFTCLAVPFKPLFDTMATFGVIAAGPVAILAFLILEGVYYSMIKICCNDTRTGDYQTFHNNLRKHLHDMTVKMAAIPETFACFCSQDLEGNSEGSRNVGQIERQASLPPPYFVSTSRCLMRITFVILLFCVR